MPRTLHKTFEICKDAIERLQLDLDGFDVLTELGTNQFAFLPILTSLAGANSVTAFVKDTKYGKADDVEARFQRLVDEVGFRQNILIRKNVLLESDIAKADIVTNSFMLRPLDAEFVAKMAPNTSVISLMYEAWEFRSLDIDLAACEARGVRVCGVSEGNEKLPIFDFCGPMLAKMVFQAGYEIMQNRIVILSNDDFGKVAEATFLALGAEKVILTNDLMLVREDLASADFLLLADYQLSGPVFSQGGAAPLFYLNECNPDLGIVHLFGDITEEDVAILGSRIFPGSPGQAHTMTRTLSFCGEIPVVWLQAAGLKAAQEVLQNIPHQFSQLINDLRVNPVRFKS
jgi:hypothetical protein